MVATSFNGCRAWRACWGSRTDSPADTVSSHASTTMSAGFGSASAIRTMSRGKTGDPLPSSSVQMTRIMSRSAPATSSRGSTVSCQSSSVMTMITGDGSRAGMPKAGKGFPVVTAATTHTHSRLLPMPSSPTSRVTAARGIRLRASQRGWAAGLRSVARHSLGEPADGSKVIDQLIEGVAGGDVVGDVLAGRGFADLDRRRDPAE